MTSRTIFFIFFWILKIELYLKYLLIFISKFNKKCNLNKKKIYPKVKNSIIKIFRISNSNLKDFQTIIFLYWKKKRRWEQGWAEFSRVRFFDSDSDRFCRIQSQIRSPFFLNQIQIRSPFFFNQIQSQIQSLFFFNPDFC